MEIFFFFTYHQTTERTRSESIHIKSKSIKNLPQNKDHNNGGNHFSTESLSDHKNHHYTVPVFMCQLFFSHQTPHTDFIYIYSIYSYTFSRHVPTITLHFALQPGYHQSHSSPPPFHPAKHCHCITKGNFRVGFIHNTHRNTSKMSIKAAHIAQILRQLLICTQIPFPRLLDFGSVL